MFCHHLMAAIHVKECAYHVHRIFFLSAAAAEPYIAARTVFAVQLAGADSDCVVRLTCKWSGSLQKLLQLTLQN